MAHVNPKICAVIPAFNEEDAIGLVLDDLAANCPGVTAIVVDDHSTDATAERAHRPGTVLLSLPINLGIGGAVQTGLKYAFDHGFDIAVQVDGDGQHPADQIGSLVEPIRDGRADVVIGSRFLEAQGYRIRRGRRAGISVLRTVVSSLARVTVTDTTSGFRAYSRRAVSFLAEYYPQDYPEPEAIVELARNGLHITEISVRMNLRKGGQSSIGARDSVYYMVKVILSAALAATRAPVVGRKDE